MCFHICFNIFCIKGPSFFHELYKAVCVKDRSSHKIETNGVKKGSGLFKLTFLKFFIFNDASMKARAVGRLSLLRLKSGRESPFIFHLTYFLWKNRLLIHPDRCITFDFFYISHPGTAGKIVKDSAAGYITRCFNENNRR